MTGREEWAAGRVPVVPKPGPGGLFDANGFLGEWPSRRLNGWPVPAGEELVTQRLRQMDRLGIERAAVSRLEGVWLKDASQANLELHALVGQRRDRFLPVYTINPAFPSWADQLARCVGEYGLARGHSALRLVPGYHGYHLGEGHDDALLAQLVELGVPVVLTVQLEDARMQHPAMMVPDLAVADVVALTMRWPQIRWIVAGCVTSQILAIGKQVPAESRVWFDIARVQGPIDCIPILCERVGVSRLVFGTNQPLHVPESPIMELADARLSEEDDAAVRFRNAGTAFG